MGCLKDWRLKLRAFKRAEYWVEVWPSNSQQYPFKIRIFRNNKCVYERITDSDDELTVNLIIKVCQSLGL